MFLLNLRVLSNILSLSFAVSFSRRSAADLLSLSSAVSFSRRSLMAHTRNSHASYYFLYWRFVLCSLRVRPTISDSSVVHALLLYTIRLESARKPGRHLECAGLATLANARRSAILVLYIGKVNTTPGQCNPHSHEACNITSGGDMVM